LPVHVFQEAAHRIGVLAEARSIPGFQLLHGAVEAVDRLLCLSRRGAGTRGFYGSARRGWCGA